MPENVLDVLVRLKAIGKEEAERLNEILEKSHGQVKKFGEGAEVSEHQIRALSHQIGEGIPGAAALMEAGFNKSTEPMMGATFLLIAGIEALRAAIEKINQEQEASKKLGEALADIDRERTHAVEKTKEALEGAEESQELFYHNLMRNTRDSIGETAKLAGALLKLSSTSLGGESSEKKDIAAKEIEDMERRGVISHETATKMKLQIDEEYHRKKVLMMLAEEQVQMQIDQNALYARTVSAGNLSLGEGTAEQRYEQALGAKTTNQTRISEAEEKIKSAQDYQKSLRDTGVTEENVQRLKDFNAKYGGNPDASLSEMFHFAAMKNLGAGAGSFAAHDIVNLFGSQGDANLAFYEGAEIDARAGRSDLARLRGKQPGLDVAESTAKSDLDNLREQLNKAKGQIAELQEKITGETAGNKIRNAGELSELGMERANTALAGARGVADRLQGGGTATAPEQQQLVQIASRIAGHNVNLQMAVHIIENGANNLDIFMQQISRLSVAFANFNPQQMQAQINNLIAQLHTSP